MKTFEVPVGLGMLPPSPTWNVMLAALDANPLDPGGPGGPDGPGPPGLPLLPGGPGGPGGPNPPEAEIVTLPTPVDGVRLILEPATSFCT